MLTEVTGLVIKSADIGESDRLITVYTKEEGVISALVKGAKSLKNKNMAATQLFCYSSFVLYKKNDKFWVRESELIESFFGIRSSIEALSLGGYILEVLSEVGTAAAEEELLRLALNSLYALAECKSSHDKVKAAFEIRSMAIIGYMPDVLTCRDCGERSGEFFFDIMSGNIQCFSCHEKEGRSGAPEIYDSSESRIIRIITEGAKIAMGYCAHCPMERLFAFSLPDGDMENFCAAAEDYLVNQLERSFKSLEFYKEVIR